MIYTSNKQKNLFYLENQIGCKLVEEKLGYKSIVKKTNGGGFDDENLVDF